VPIHIREAEPGDADIVIELVGQLARGEGQESPVSQAYVLKYLAVDGNGILLAEKDGQILGLISYSIRPNLYHAAASCLIEELFVRQDARGQGIGGLLIAEVIKRSHESGAAEISVSTMPDNERVIAFYKKLGFVDQALFLEKHLDV